MDKHEGNGEARHGLQVVQKTEPTSSQEKSQHPRRGLLSNCGWLCLTRIAVWRSCTDYAVFSFLPFQSCVASQFSEARQRSGVSQRLLRWRHKPEEEAIDIMTVCRRIVNQITHTHFYSDGQILGVSAHPRSRSELRNLPRTKPRQARRRFDWLQKGAALFFEFLPCSPSSTDPGASSHNWPSASCIHGPPVICSRMF